MALRMRARQRCYRSLLGRYLAGAISTRYISVFNGIGALGATGWALVAEGFGWHGFFIGGIIVLTITFGLLGYTWHAGDKARRKTWFKSDAELAAEAHKAVESA